MRKHGEKRYAVAGTPTDAVMMALAKIMKDCPPDLILSGVNRGANLAEDVTYSGTVSAAMEGALGGIRSIALSQIYSREGMGDSVPFEAAAAWGERVLRPLLEGRSVPVAKAPPTVVPALPAKRTGSTAVRADGKTTKVKAAEVKAAGAAKAARVPARKAS